VSDVDLGSTLAELAEWRKGLEAAAEQVAALGANPSAHKVSEVLDDHAKGSHGDADDSSKSDRGPKAVPAYNPFLVPGEPTPEAYAALSASQMADLEQIHPGVGERMRKAVEWDERSAAAAKHDLVERVLSEHETKLESDESYLAEVMRKRAAEQLRAGIGSLSQRQLDRLRGDAQMSDEEYAEIERENRERALRRMGVEQ